MGYHWDIIGITLGMHWNCTGIAPEKNSRISVLSKVLHYLWTDSLFILLAQPHPFQVYQIHGCAGQPGHVLLQEMLSLVIV